MLFLLRALLQFKHTGEITTNLSKFVFRYQVRLIWCKIHYNCGSPFTCFAAIYRSRI